MLAFHLSGSKVMFGFNIDIECNKIEATKIYLVDMICGLFDDSKDKKNQRNCETSLRMLLGTI